MFGYLFMIARYLLTLPLVLIALVVPCSADAAPFPEGFSVIGMHGDTFYGLDSKNGSVVRWINQRTGAAGELSTGGVRSDIFETGLFANPNGRTVFSSSGMAVGPPSDTPTGHPRQLYRVTRERGFEVLASAGPWSHQTCGQRLVPLHIDAAGEVLAVEAAISPSGGACGATNNTRLVRYDRTGEPHTLAIPARLRNWIRWNYSSINVVSSGRHVAIVRRITKRAPQSRLAIIDARTGKRVRELDAAPRGFNADIEFATPGRLLVSSRIRGRRSQIKHVPINGRARVIKRGFIPSVVRACGTRTAATDRSEAIWIYDSSGKQLRKIPSDGFSEPYGMLCSSSFLYYVFGPFDEIGTGITEGIVRFTGRR